jgi:signal transduction histidine kinase
MQDPGTLAAIQPDPAEHLSDVARPPLWRQQLRLLRPLLLAVPLLMLVAVLGLETLSLTQAMVEAESRWAKGVKDAVQYLDQYSHTCDPVLRGRFSRAMVAPLASIEGRTLLRQTPPDFERAAVALQRAGGNPVNQELRLLMLAHGRHLPMMARLDQIWSEAGGLLQEIDVLAGQLDRLIAEKGCADPDGRQPLMRQVYWVNERLSPRLSEFVELVAAIHRRWHAALMALLLASGALVLGVGVLLARRTVHADHVAAQAVQAELAARRRSVAALRQTMRTLDEAPAPADGEGRAPAADAQVHDIIGQVTRLAARQRADHAALQAIFARSPDAFVSFDATGRVSHVSPAFSALTGLAGAAALGCDERALVALLNRQALADEALPVSADGRLAAAGGPCLLGLQGPQPRTLEVTAFQATADGQPTVLCLRDVTRSLALERLKGEFMTTAAHELRTPMASIFGFVELLRVRVMSEARRKELLDIVHRQARQMVGILDDLLDLSRLESRGRADLQRTPLDLAALAQEVAAGFACPPGREPPQLQAGAALPPVSADRDKLVRVLVNLLSNAYKYCRPVAAWCCACWTRPRPTAAGAWAWPCRTRAWA